MLYRKIKTIYRPEPSQGFLGEGHIALPVIHGTKFEQTDPFILLMDDQLDLPGHGTVGGPHPHAGFETVTLVLEGNNNNMHNTFQTGSIEWMTAGSGIIHTEEIRTKVKLRILQLWLVLPKSKRWIEPKWQELLLENVPTKEEGNNEMRVYSGTSLGITSPIHNETPTTIIDFNLEAGYEVTPDIPASYNAFVYVIEGSVNVAEGKTEVEKNQVAWFERHNETDVSYLKFRAGKYGARFILYAGEPQRSPVVSHGPFIGDTKEDIVRLYSEYRQGKMKHVKDLPGTHVIHHSNLLAT
jgi:redox-sensitive bicupin YhaK (pirin superfamily)